MCVRAVGAANSSTATTLVQRAVTVTKERRTTVKTCYSGRKRVEAKRKTMDRSSTDTGVHQFSHPPSLHLPRFLPSPNDLLLPGLVLSSVRQCRVWAEQFVHFYKRSQAGRRLAGGQSPCFFTAGSKGNWRRVLLHAESPSITSACAGKIMTALMQKSMHWHICCTTVHILISISICLQ